MGHPGMFQVMRCICKYCKCEMKDFDSLEGDHSSQCPRYSGCSSSSFWASSEDNVLTLYHQTDADSAQSILQSQTFRCGQDGLVGGGIYFAASSSDTGHKAHRRGVILKARVNLGRIKIVEHGHEAGVNARSVSSQGYDSVRINRHGGTEYCVYDESRITNIERA